jgi:hypothetical protein
MKLLKDMFDEVVSEAMQSISVYDDQFRDHFLTYEIQELLESLSLKVLVVADFLDDFVAWAFGFEVLNLSLQVFFLFG